MRERESVRLAFRMREIADGAFLEDLEIILGKLIRPAPDLFLAELQRAHVPPGALGGLVGNLGGSYDDKMREQCAELRRRMKAVRGVRTPYLQEPKEQVLSALEAGSWFCRRSEAVTPNPSFTTDPQQRHFAPPLRAG